MAQIRGRTTPRLTSGGSAYLSTVTYTPSHQMQGSDSPSYLLHVTGLILNQRDQNGDFWYGSTVDSGTVPSAPWYSVRQDYPG
ncbi:hypothetical protein TNCT_490301 [Trichonephila clavata]|uniref:Uncharacterized protein n=1 Tax=Trichonephila clavata TaxID=2740835 RepID=A0A8X6GEZ8_TRICU|nr:hypothetical protein TNCT_490301 [Trichonephila clavata]